MTLYIARRALGTLPVLLVVSLVVFGMVHFVPGDPILTVIGETGARISPEMVEQLRREFGLDDPLHVQYARFLGKAIQGDLGRSIITGRPVRDELLSQLPRTIELTVAGLGIAVCFGLAMGILAAIHHRRWVDNVAMLVALLGVSMPSFWLGLMLIFVFALWLGWVPVLGQGGIERLVLPAVTLALGASAVIARLVRSSMLDVLRQDYMVTARAKGLTERVVISRHALRNALIPAVTIVGLQFGHLLAGTVVIETVFSRQGLGRLMVGAILARDFPVIQGAVLFTAVTYVFANLLVDLIYAALNPRIRYR